MPASLMCWLWEPERRRGRGAGSELPSVESPGAGKGQGSGQRGDLRAAAQPLGKRSISGRRASCLGEASVGGGYQGVRRIMRGRG